MGGHPTAIQWDDPAAAKIAPLSEFPEQFTAHNDHAIAKPFRDEEGAGEIQGHAFWIRGGQIEVILALQDRFCHVVQCKGGFLLGRANAVAEQKREGQPLGWSKDLITSRTERAGQPSVFCFHTGFYLRSHPTGHKQTAYRTSAAPSTGFGSWPLRPAPSRFKAH
jgi:hypothetical protein